MSLGPTLRCAAANPVHCRWDAHTHMLVRYAFKDAPDHSRLPPPAERDEDASDEDYSDSEGEEYDSEGGDSDSDSEEEQWRPRESSYGYW